MWALLGYWYFHIGVAPFCFATLLMYSPDRRTFQSQVLRTVSMNVFMCLYVWMAFMTMPAVWDFDMLRASFLDFLYIVDLNEDRSYYGHVSFQMSRPWWTTPHEFMENYTQCTLPAKGNPGGVSSSLVVSSFQVWSFEASFTCKQNGFKHLHPRRLT